MNSFDYIFIVLVYRNVSDLRSFFEKFKVQNSKVIVVNSYFDHVSDLEFKKISDKNDADYIRIENKGYGYGNNRGVQYALEKYCFRYLVISNADIEIVKFDIDLLGLDNCIIAPKIITLTGKNQNPYIPYKIYGALSFEYFACIHNLQFLLYFYYALNKLARVLFRLLNYSFGVEEIYASHGSFMIVPFDVAKRLYPFYNEKMFLFAEEGHFAMLLRRNGVKTRYNPNIIILHKEDGSVKSLNQRLYDIKRQSIIEMYRYWRQL